MWPLLGYFRIPTFNFHQNSYSYVRFSSHTRVFIGSHPLVCHNAWQGLDEVVLYMKRYTYQTQHRMTYWVTYWMTCRRTYLKHRNHHLTRRSSRAGNTPRKRTLSQRIPFLPIFEFVDAKQLRKAYHTALEASKLRWLRFSSLTIGRVFHFIWFFENRNDRLVNLVPLNVRFRPGVTPARFWLPSSSFRISGAK